jgi:hypothetical protein
MKFRCRLYGDQFQIDAWRHLVTFVCAWEIVALTTRKPPTVSALCKRHKGLPFLIMGGLALHFWLF